jgi:hypothetical protein
MYEKEYDFCRSSNNNENHDGMKDFKSHGPQWYAKRISPFLRDLDPVMAEIQVPSAEPRGRRRSADAGVGVDPLFGVHLWRSLRGGAANPQSALGSGIPEESSFQPALVDSTTIPHQHQLHSKSPKVLDVK